MAGIALLIDYRESPIEQFNAWSNYLRSVQNFKGLEQIGGLVQENSYIAAKLDAPCGSHPGITRDPSSGSWIMAVGTVFDPASQQPQENLMQLLQDFQEIGNSVFTRLDGQFALLAYNAFERSLSLVTDHFGFIPLYYGQHGGRFYTGTSALAIAKAIRSTPSDIHARSLLLYGDTLDGTLWEGVHVLKPASVLTFTAEKTTETNYWSFVPDLAIHQLSLANSVDCIIDGLSKTEKDLFGREGQFWISLTGGLDSRTLAAIAHYSQLSFKTYCHGPSDARDVHLSARISQQMGWEHEYLSLPDDWGYERVEWIPAALGQTDGHMDVLKMSRIIREQTIKARQFTTSLWGYGGEIYRGYYWKQEFWRTGKSSKVDYQRLLDFRIIPISTSVLMEEERWKLALREAKKQQMESIGEKQPDFLNTVKLDLIGQALELHAGSNTIGGILGQQRVMLPYYSKDNITRVISTNHRWRTHSRLFRLILERINPQLAAIEMADGGPATPMRWLNAYKFIPYWVDTGDKLLWRLAYQYLGKSLWSRRDPGPEGRAYPNGRWLKETVSVLRNQNLLIPEKMASSSIYAKNNLEALLKNALQGNPGAEKLLGRVLTLEMALQAVGTTF